VTGREETLASPTSLWSKRHTYGDGPSTNSVSSRSCLHARAQGAGLRGGAADGARSGDLRLVAARMRRRKQADQAFNSLRERFYDWNEVRVSTVRELEDRSRA